MILSLNHKCGEVCEWREEKGLDVDTTKQEVNMQPREKQKTFAFTNMAFFFHLEMDSTANNELHYKNKI